MDVLFDDIDIPLIPQLHILQSGVQYCTCTYSTIHTIQIVRGIELNLSLSVAECGLTSFQEVILRPMITNLLYCTYHQEKMRNLEE